MTVIFDKEIKRRILDENLIQKFSYDNIWGASYDMRLGYECAKDGAVVDLKNNKIPSIMPGEFVLLTTHESLNLPLNMVGRNGIMSKWAKRGLVSLFSPQIDPGFKGILVVPVFNAGDQEVLLKHMEKVFTVEFDVDPHAQASFGWSEKMGTQDRLSADHVQMLKVSMSHTKDVASIKNRIESLQALANSAEAFSKEAKNKVSEIEKQFDSFRKEIDAHVKGQSGSHQMLMRIILLAIGAIIATTGYLASDFIKNLRNETEESRVRNKI